MKKVLVINGPNLNLLGKREKDLYGSFTLQDINREVSKYAKELGISVSFFQSNYEGEIVSKIQEAEEEFDVLIINPGAFTHTSIAIRDAILAVDIPTIEVHLTNVYKREKFRRVSYIEDIAFGKICGFGYVGYLMAIYAAKAIIDGKIRAF